jgi:hypothetical protein
MKLIRPTVITDAMLTSSDVPEGAGTAWSSATTYALGARVDVATGTVIDVYQSLQASNLNHAPASSPTWWQKVATTYAAWNSATTYAAGNIVASTTTHRRYQSVQNTNTNHPLTDTAWWLDIGPTNRWAMFDQGVGSLSTETGAINVTLAPGSVDSLAVLDTDAETVTVTMTNSGSTVYSSTQSTNVGGEAIDSWYKWFFSPIGKKTTLTFLDLPSFPDGIITITFTGSNTAGPVNVGTLVVGRQLDIGSTETGASVGITDYSKKGTDDFGVTTVVERAWSKRAEARCMLDTANVDAMQRELAKVRAIPCVWIIEDGFDSLTIYGFFKDFSLDLAFANISYCSLTVEGLT